MRVVKTYLPGSSRCLPPQHDLFICDGCGRDSYQRWKVADCEKTHPFIPPPQRFYDRIQDWRREAERQAHQQVMREREAARQKAREAEEKRLRAENEERLERQRMFEAFASVQPQPVFIGGDPKAARDPHGPDNNYGLYGVPLYENGQYVGWDDTQSWMSRAARSRKGRREPTYEERVRRAKRKRQMATRY